MSERTLFSTVRTERLYEKIIRQLLALIEEGKLKPGDRLPAERKLAETLGCSRTSLREACRVLESEGIIISKPGGGRYIQRVDTRLTVDYPITTIDQLEKTAIIYFLEAREAIEPKIVELACQRATDEDIQKMELALSHMEEKLKFPEEQIEDDGNFHLALAEASQNFVLVSMMKANVNMIRQVRKQTLHSDDRYLESLQEHRAILEAIKQRNLELALEANRIHLLHIRNRVLGNYGETK